MNDRIIMENYLLVIKSTIEVYIHGTLESSNFDIRDILKSGLDETIKHQEKCFDEMTKFGWYDIKNVNLNIIKQTIKMINSKNQE